MSRTDDVADRRRPTAGASPPASERSTGQLLGDALGEVQTIVRKEIELAKHELREAAIVRGQAAAALVVGGVLGLIGLVCALTAAAWGLGTVLPMWAAWAIVAGALFVLAGAAFVVARARARAVPLEPELTRRSIEENATWARTQLQR